ncbi:hypothetical protein H5410_049140 [Solanum commersonii]|uniref:Late blight resistance protein homolog R1A-3 n=1 Tax=Solanum commersonii TaxID=4109 RepID=A0A9J5XLP4_SOLCO|nr:hypothetical protein H5410_049140 [Solanum commersonii]
MQINAEVTEMWSDDSPLNPHYVAAPFKHLPARHSNIVTDEEVVGFENKAEKLIDYLIRGTNELDVVPIVGMGDKGKRQLLESCTIMTSFRRELLKEIFSQVTGSKDNEDEVGELADRLRKCLMGKRYLIVLDDMWDCMAWDDLRLSFPDVGMRSRIVVTTRLEEVGKQVKYHTDPYSLPFLTTEESCQLLQKKVFQKEDCPPELQYVSQAVAEKCKGLPLVVVLVAGIIKKRKMEESWWNEVKDALFDYLDSESEEYSLATMQLSFDNLPNCLKPCLLYMGMFSEDARIPASKLISLWIAEGFVENTESGRLMEEAEGYLMDLISSNVVMLSKRSYNGKVKYCQVHDVVHHFCLEKSREEKFMLAVKGQYIQFQPLDWKGSRVSFSFSEELSKVASLVSKTRKPFHQHLRSLITTNRRKSIGVIPFCQISELRLLKILDLSSYHVEFLSSATFKPLNHLKYLAVWANKFYFHPESHLPHIETLIVQNYPFIVQLPASLWEMEKLRHWLFEGSSKLENLRILKKIVGFPIDRVDVLSRRCPNLQQLHIKFDGHSADSFCLTLENLTQLQILRVSFEQPHIIVSGLQLPSNLNKLVLKGIHIDSAIPFIAGLPSLEYLQLKAVCFSQSEEWCLGDIMFHKLKLLKLLQLDISRWDASEESFPLLETLVIKECEDLEEIPLSFADIPSLKQIKLMGPWKESLEDSAVRIKEEIKEIEGCGRIFLRKMAENEIEEMLDHLRRIKSGGNLSSFKIDQTKKLEIVLRVFRTFIKYHHVILWDPLVKLTNKTVSTVLILHGIFDGIPDECKTRLNLERLESHLLEFLEQINGYVNHEKLECLETRIQFMANNVGQHCLAISVNIVADFVHEKDEDDTSEHEFMNKPPYLLFLIVLVELEMKKIFLCELKTSKFTRSRTFKDKKLPKGFSHHLHSLLMYLRNKKLENFPKNISAQNIDVAIEFLLVFLDANVSNHAINGNWLNEVMEKVGAIAGDVLYVIQKLLPRSINKDDISKISLCSIQILEKTKDLKAQVETYYKSLKFTPSQFPTSGGLSFLDSLIRKLNEMSKSKSGLDFLMKPLLGNLEKELSSLASILEKELSSILRVTKVHHEHKILKDLQRRTINLAYEVEVAIDYILSQYDVFWHIFCSLPTILKEIKQINVEVTELCEVALKPCYVVAPSKHLPARHSNSVTDEELVGFGNDIEKMIQYLIRGTNELDVIPIVGMGGQGKTTCARKLYNNDIIVSQFDVQAWCIISQTYNRRELLQDILSQVTNYEDKGEKDDVLADMLRKSLMGKRYLIVLDDMWDCMAWDDLRLCFPDVRNRSRIVVTTRLKKVSEQVKYHTEPYSLPFLTKEESCKLLQKKVFQKEDFPPELQDVCQAVAVKCKGLPLVVILVAGIIKKRKMEESWWSEVKDALYGYLDRGSEEYSRATMQLSFDNLPDCLKPCLLYMGMFPEDAIIPVYILASLWTAEGFVLDIESAEDYLMDLIHSNVVMVLKREYNGKVIYCQVHDVVLHFCLEKSREENFMLAVKGHGSQFQPLDWKGSRVSFSFSEKHSKLGSLVSITRKHFHQHLRSLITTNRGKSIDVIPFCQISELRLLKVLDLSSYSVDFVSSATFKPLNLLKYLAVWAMKFYFHPESHLPHIETLIVKNNLNIVLLPVSFWEMEKLRHLEIVEAEFDKQGIDEGSSKLENLRILGKVRFSIDEADRLDVFLQRCPNLQQLYIDFEDSYSADLFGDDYAESFCLTLENLTQLQMLCLSTESPIVLTRLQLPSNLKELVLFETVSVISFIAELPNLEYLLIVKAYFIEENEPYLSQLEEWCHEDITFHKLKYLELVELDISRWDASEESFPRLETLVIKECNRLEEIPLSFADIPTLKKIKLSGGSKKSLKDSAVRIKKDVEENEGNDRIDLIIKKMAENEIEEMLDHLIKRIDSGGNLRSVSIFQIRELEMALRIFRNFIKYHDVLLSDSLVKLTKKSQMDCANASPGNTSLSYNYELNDFDLSKYMDCLGKILNDKLKIVQKKLRVLKYTHATEINGYVNYEKLECLETRVQFMANNVGQFCLAILDYGAAIEVKDENDIFNKPPCLLSLIVLVEFEMKKIFPVELKASKFTQSKTFKDKKLLKGFSHHLHSLLMYLRNKKIEGFPNIISADQNIDMAIEFLLLFLDADVSNHVINDNWLNEVMEKVGAIAGDALYVIQKLLPSSINKDDTIKISLCSIQILQKTKDLKEQVETYYKSLKLTPSQFPTFGG